jgi:hypothetical protein
MEVEVILPNTPGTMMLIVNTGALHSAAVVDVGGKSPPDDRQTLRPARAAGRSRRYPMTGSTENTNAAEAPPTTPAPTWQSTLIALALIALVGTTFLLVYYRSGIDDSLKAYGAVGTIVGVITGAVPTYFFGQQRAAAAERSAEQARQLAQAEQQRRDVAEDRAQLVLAHADPTVIQTLQESRPDLF